MLDDFVFGIPEGLPGRNEPGPTMTGKPISFSFSFPININVLK